MPKRKDKLYNGENLKDFRELVGRYENRYKDNIAFMYKKDPKDTEVIKITVTNKNPDYAAKIANEISNVFSKKVADIYKINNVYVVDVAEIENEPYNINHAKDIIIFAFIGIVVACAYILIRNMLDNTIKSDADVEKMGLTVLAQLPMYDFDERVRGGK